MDQDTGNIKLFLETGDVRAFGKLMSKYKDQVYNYCFVYFGNSDDADDNSQEIFIKVYKKLASFKYESLFSSWLYRIMVNHCHNTYRSKVYKMRRKMSNVDNTEIRNGSLNPESITINKELETIIYSAINVLKGKQKTVLILRDIDGKSYEEISQIMNLNMGTVKSALARARKKVATKLKSKHVL